MKLSLKLLVVTVLLLVSTMFNWTTAQNIYMLNTRAEGGVTFTTCYDMLMPRSRNFGAIVNGQIVVPCKYSYVSGKGGHLFAYPLISIGPADVYTPSGLLLFPQSKGIVDAVRMRDSGKTLFVSQSNKWYDRNGEYLFTAADVLGIGTSEPEWVASVGKYLIKDYKTNKWYDENGKYYGTYNNSSDIVVNRNEDLSARRTQTTASSNSYSGVSDITLSFFSTNKKYYVKETNTIVPGEEEWVKKEFQWGEMDISITNTLANRTITFRDEGGPSSETLIGIRECEIIDFHGKNDKKRLYITTRDDYQIGYIIAQDKGGKIDKERNIHIYMWFYYEKLDIYIPFGIYTLFKD